MAPAHLYNVLTYLRQVTHPRGAGDRSDAELLRRFVAGRDAGAFEALLQRHGPKVLAVCRRILDNEADAEDAFQVVFLVLVRQADAVARHESVGSFLHGVALRTALRARSDLAKRRHHERHGPTMPAADPPPDTAWQDLRLVLDEEVARLPGKYREPFRLCYLEGKTYDEAAQALGCSKGTVSSRLTRARERLRRRLVGRGVTLSGGLLAAVLSARAAPAAVPPPLLQVTLRAAVEIATGPAGAAGVSSQVLQLTERMVQSMSLSKLRIVGGVLLAACAVGVAGVALSRVPWAGDSAAIPRDEAPARAEGVPAWQECARLGSAVGGARYALFAPDSRTLATVDGDRVLRLWDTATWEQRLRYDIRKRYADRYMLYTPFSPDGRLLTLGGDVPNRDKPGQRLPEVMVLEVATGREIAHLPGHDGRFCPDGTAVLTWLNDTATLWDLPTYRKRLDLKAAGPLCRFVLPTFSEDGALLFTATTSGRAHLWETATGKERATVEGYTAAFAPDGKTLATELPGGVIKLWDTSTGRERAAIRSGGNTGLSPRFSPDGRRLLTHPTFVLKADGKPDLSPGGPVSQLRIRPLDIRLWDAATGKDLTQLPGMNKYDAIANFSPDGKTIVYARLEPDETDREEVVLWDVEAGKERLVLHAPEGVRMALFSPDGKVLFTGDATGAHLKVWDPATGRRLPDVSGVTDALRLCCSPDGRLLAASPGTFDPGDAGSKDLVVYRLSDRPLPPPVVRGQPAGDAPGPAQTRAEEPPRTRVAQALADLRKESEAAAQDLLPKLQAAKTDAERKPLEDQFTQSQARFAARALAIAREHPADPAAVEALEFALHTTSGGFGGAAGKVRDEALDLIRKEFLRSPHLSRVLYFLAHQHTDPAGDLLAEIAETSPHRVIQGRAAYVLAEELAEKAEAARLIRLPDLAKRPELQEKAALVEQLRKADPDALDRKAEACYTRVKEKYADVARSEHEPGTLGDAAKRGLFALRHLGLGKTAPDVEGEDLDGKRFQLSEYRGRVVVLVFCGHWCGPCREMNPQKQGLVERLAGQPFALLEVNSDEDREAVRRTMRKEKLTWRCWFDGGREGAIARRWNVQRWPSIYVLDAQGVIRYKDLRGQALDEAVMRLLQEAGSAPRPGR
jgi:RNA polymerase sigma factor (sigma-70 family)